MKNYRFYESEMEILGNRLDASRKALANAKSEWAKNYWKKSVEVLLSQWRKLPILHDGDAQVTLVPKWEVKYDSFEKHDSISHNGVDDKVYNIVFNREPNLDWSWENNRAQRLARAQ